MIQIEYLNIYDVNNNIIDGWINLSGSSTGITYFLFPVPDNAYKIVYGMVFSGDTYENIKYVKGCNRNQYFYFNDNYVDTIYCTGKKENRINITKQILQEGIKNNVVEIKYKQKIEQNTGLKLSENELIGIGSSPYIFEISGTTVKDYILDDEVTQGFNTRTFGDRNTILNLTKVTTERRYTKEQNNFYN